MGFEAWRLKLGAGRAFPFDPLTETSLCLEWRNCVTIRGRDRNSKDIPDPGLGKTASDAVFAHKFR